MTVLVVVALVLELGLLAYAIASAIQERTALARFVRAAAEPDRLKDVAMQLPHAYRAPATAFAGELARKAPLDDVLTQAITRAANTPFGLPLPASIGVGAGLAGLVFAPLGSALLDSARSIRDAATAARAIAGSRAFLDAKDHLEPTFEALHLAAEATAFLLAGLVVVGAVHWWLNRSEVREARFVQALLETAIASRPNATAAVSGRLSQLLAPERTMELPAAAFAAFMLALAVGWSMLWASADVREANAANVYNVWPTDAKAPLKSPLGMVVPSFGGGGLPVRERSLATVAVGPERVDVAGELLVDLDARFALPEKFPQGANNLDRALSGFKRGAALEVNLLGHASVPMNTVLGVLLHLRNTQGLRRVNCVLERSLGVAPASAPSPRVPAVIAVDLGLVESVQPTMVLAVEGASITVDPGTPEALSVDRDDPAWRQRLGQIVRTRTGAKLGDAGAPIVHVRLKSTELQYDRFLEILASADSTCTLPGDCGVPGLGVRFQLERQN